MPLPEPIVGRHLSNDLDRLLSKMRSKCLTKIIKKCELLIEMEFGLILGELENIYDSLSQIENEVNLK